MEKTLDLRKGEYCVLNNPKKGLILSKVKVARELKFEPIFVGDKEQCENYIAENKLTYATVGEIPGKIKKSVNG